MAVLSLVFLGVVVADLAAPADAPYRAWLDRASLAIWAVFVGEFLVKLALAPARREFLRRRWFDVLVLIVPFLRVLRALRLVRAARAARGLRYVSLFRLGTATRRGGRALARFSRASRFGTVAAFTGVIVLVGAAAMRFLERDAQGAPIRTFREALWWSASTVTTIGGDLQPVTDGGRVLAVAMMLYAVVVFGYLVSQAVVFIQGPGSLPLVLEPHGRGATIGERRREGEGTMPRLAEALDRCIQACAQCHRVCLETTNHCLAKGGAHAEQGHVRLLLDCVEICRTAADFMIRGSTFHQRTCGVCAEICERCAADCDRFDDPEMRACAEACRRCAEACRQMAA